MFLCFCADKMHMRLALRFVWGVAVSITASHAVPGDPLFML